jgi:hypothetical protein
MNSQFRFGIIICLFLIIAVLFAGCSEESPDTAVSTPVPTTAAGARYSPGDIIAKTDSGGETMLYVIKAYNPAKDEYERAWIYKNADGSWGHFIDQRTEWSDREMVENFYKVKVARVTLSAVPIATLAAATPVPTTLSGNSPTVIAITPSSAIKDATLSVVITGTNFQQGATPRLLQPGSMPVTGTGVIVTSTRIDCMFNLYNREAGRYNVIVVNPDGQSGTLQAAFTVGEAGPIITSVAPTALYINDTTQLVIYGQNFKEGVTVNLLKGGSTIPCTSPSSSGGTKITCDLDLNLERQSAVKAGDWDVKVLNIEGSQTGTWTRKVTISNATSPGS